VLPQKHLSFSFFFSLYFLAFFCFAFFFLRTKHAFLFQAFSFSNLVIDQSNAKQRVQQFQAAMG
jgi:hypothetical protein